MKNEKFIQFRKRHGFSQAKLADIMLIPIKTIRNWEYGKSIPSIEDMEKMASVFSVGHRDIVNLFSPEKTKAREEKEKEGELYDWLVEQFWDCDTADEFFCIMSLFAIGKMSGIITCGEYVFPFEKVFAELHGSAAVFADASENYIVLTEYNISSISPVSVHFDVYTFDIDMECPMFPVDDSFQYGSIQKIRISLFNR